MKRKNTVLTLLILFILFFQRDNFANENEVVWLTADFPPFSIVSGPYKNKGSLNFVREKVRSALKEYIFVTQVANPKRIFHELRRQDRVLFATAAKTPEREKYLLYSVPYVIVFPHHLITLKKNVPSIKPYIVNNEILFDKALKESNLMIGYSIGRQYGKYLNQRLNKYKESRNLKVYYNDYFKESFVHLLDDRIDCILGLPNEAEYFLKILNRGEEVLMFPFKGEGKYSTGYFVLPRTKWGEKTLKVINSVIIKFRNTEVFHRSFERWLSRENRKLYRKYVKEFYKDNPH